MPVVTVREEMYTPATFNTDRLSNRALELFTASFGPERVKKVTAVMGGEDFSRFWLADKSMGSLIFWVGGVPANQWQAAGGDAAKLPSLHSPFWAPDAEAVVAEPTPAVCSSPPGTAPSAGWPAACTAWLRPARRWLRISSRSSSAWRRLR